MMNSDAARSDAFTKYCIASNMSRDEVSQAAAVFASAWDAGAEYGAERAEAERDALRAEVEKWRRIRKPTHGPCCTCQACGLDYDSCRCDLDDIADQLNAARAEVASLREELARMSDEFADVLDVAIARGAALGYDSDSDYIQRWEELTGDEWVEE